MVLDEISEIFFIHVAALKIQTTIPIDCSLIALIAAF